MIIHAIRFTRTSDQKEFYLRFPRYTGNLRHFYCFHSSTNDLHSFRHALDFALTGVPNKETSAASLNLIDADGHSWVIDRKKKQEKFYRNRKPVDNETFKSYFTSYLDLDTAEGSASIIKTLELEAHNDKLLAYQMQETKAPQALVEIWSDTVTNVKKDFPFLGSLNPDDTIDLLLAVAPIYSQWKSLASYSTELKSMSSHLRDVDATYLDSLEEQIEILSKIEDLSSELLDPNQTPEAMSERLGELEKKYKEICLECGLDHIPAVKEYIDWELTLRTLGRLKLYENLEKTSELAIQKVRVSIEPVLTAYIETIDTFLKSDSQIIGELESCLGALTSHLTNLPDPSPVNWFQKLAQILKPSEAPSETLLLSEGRNTPESPQLENSRMAVDYALGRLGELHANHKQNQKTENNSTEQMMERHEKISSEFNRLKFSWKQLAEQYDLPENCSIKAILNLVQSYGTLFDLWNKMDVLKNSIKLHRKKMSQLEGLMTHFRKVTCSQKISDLRDPSILIAETRAVLQYASKKRNQLSKLKKMEIQSCANRHISNLLNRQQQRILSDWNRAFEEHDLPPISLDEPAISQALEQGALIRALRSKIKHAPLLFSNSDIFGDQALDAPITLFLTMKKQASPLVVEHLKTSSSAGLGIILTPDDSLAEDLRKMNVAIATHVTPSTSEKKFRENKDKEKPQILSNKAKEALQLFHPKQQSKSLSDLIES